ncbi:hypothetical protein V5799_025585 [Amblyomma americanum]|uniref:Uncharacterized protein n=1 Tax=Amblyomma americanum TaxID=6943 RepID=A0AAQ4E8U1_AMBAM
MQSQAVPFSITVLITITCPTPSTVPSSQQASQHRSHYRRYGLPHAQYSLFSAQLTSQHFLLPASNAVTWTPSCPTNPGKLSVDDTPGFTRVSPFQWQANEAAFDDDRGSEDDVMMIAYSSGTSGLPKNIELQRRYLIYYVVATDPQFRVLSIERQVQKRGCGPPPSLRSVVLFGAPVTVTAAREITATLRPLVFRNAYGTTETGFVAVPPRGECA